MEFYVSLIKKQIELRGSGGGRTVLVCRNLHQLLKIQMLRGIGSGWTMQPGRGSGGRRTERRTVRQKLDRPSLRQRGSTRESRKRRRQEHSAPRQLHRMPTRRGMHGSGRGKTVRIRRDMHRMRKLSNMQRCSCGRTVQLGGTDDTKCGRGRRIGRSRRHSDTERSTASHSNLQRSRPLLWTTRNRNGRSCNSPTRTGPTGGQHQR